jgi:hypothetical protein
MTQPVFVKLPVEPADPWFRLRWQDRALGADMFRVFGNDERLDVALEEVADVVCRRLAVDGRDRPTVRRGIERLIAERLLVPDGQTTCLLYSRDAHRAWMSRPVNARPSTGDRPVTDQPSTGDRPVNVQSFTGESEASGGNGSEQALEIDREIDKKERERERAQARDPLPPVVELEDGEPEPEASTLELVTLGYRRRYAAATGDPPGQSYKLRAHYESVAKWVDEKDGDAPRLVETLLDGFFSDPWAKSKRFPLGALAGEPGKYFARKKRGGGFMRTSPESAFNGRGTKVSDLGPAPPGEAE